MSITSEPIFTIEVTLSPPVVVGETPLGMRRVIPISGGTVSGPELNGTVLPGGADWNVMRPDDSVHVWARYELRTDDGAVVSIINEGSMPVDRSTPPGPGVTMPTMITTPRFEVGQGGPTWLNAGAYVGELRAKPELGLVQITVYRLTSRD